MEYVLKIQNSNIIITKWEQHLLYRVKNCAKTKLHQNKKTFNANEHTNPKRVDDINVIR